MRAPAGDRSGPAIAALCLAVVICTAGAGAANASYGILPDGTAYSAAVEVNGTGSYTFFEYGPFGERIPHPVSNVSLRGPCGNCSFTLTDNTTLSFTQGNYTILYEGRIQENRLQGNFESPYRVSVAIPPGLDVRNPLIGFLSPGSEVTADGEGITVVWNRTRAFDLRFYEPWRERMLILLGASWLGGLLLFLVPYLLARSGGSRDD